MIGPLKTYQSISKKQWVILVSFWLIITLIITNQLYFTSIKNGLDPSWLTLFADQLPIWLTWAAMSPFLLYLINAYPFDIKRWVPSLAIHLLFSLLFLLIVSNLTLIYLLTLHQYLDLKTATFGQYLPYFFSRFINDSLIYSLVLMVMIVSRSYSIRKNNELNMALMKLKNHQLQNQLTQAQLQALKLQLSPHFLFNTLNTITSLTLIGERQVSIDVTTKLGDFLRRTLDFEAHQLVTLSKELEFFDLYLEIESVRFKDRLRLVRQIDQDCLSIKVPNLILQPLIENAVKYGISKSRDASLIELKIKRNKDFVEVELFNEGPYLNTDHSRKGIGLSNIKNRLKKLYHENYSIALKNDELREGVKSILKVPINEN